MPHSVGEWTTGSGVEKGGGDMSRSAWMFAAVWVMALGTASAAEVTLRLGGPWTTGSNLHMGMEKFAESLAGVRIVVVYGACRPYEGKVSPAGLVERMRISSR